MTSCSSGTFGNINLDDDNFRTSVASNSYVTETANTSTNELNISHETIERTDLKGECRKRPYLDDIWFASDLTRSSCTGKVYGTCQICISDNSKNSIISGTLNSSSTFKTHLKRVHSQRVTEFESYCLAKRQCLQISQNSKNRRAYCNFSQREFQQNIINFILDSFAPFNTVKTIISQNF